MCATASGSLLGSGSFARIKTDLIACINYIFGMYAVFKLVSVYSAAARIGLSQVSVPERFFKFFRSDNPMLAQPFLSQVRSMATLKEGFRS